MRRKKDDKRVLRPGNGHQSTSRLKRMRMNNNRNNRSFLSNNRNRSNRNRPNGNRKRSKSNNKLVFFMIFALVAFVIGAGIGVSLSLDDGSSDEPHFENVTKEMTTNLNDTPDLDYDSEDEVDFNENKTSQFNVEAQYIEE